MKKLLIILSLTIAMLLGAPAVLAQDATCVTQYGGGIVCGRKTPETPIVPAGLGDINFSLVGVGFLIASAGLYFYNRKNKSVSSHSAV